MKRKLIMQRCVKLLCLVLCVVLLSGVCSALCSYYDYNVLKLAGFYAEPENTLDVVLLGASEVFTGFSSAYAYDLHGFTSYPYALDAAPASLHESQIREVLNHQNPKWIVLEINGFLYDAPELQTDSGSMRRYLNNIPLSWNRVRTTLELIPREDWYIYFFPLAKRHSNWKAIPEQGENIQDLLTIQFHGSLLKGNVTSVNPFDPLPMRDVANDYSTAPLEPLAEQYLISLLEYCKENQLDNILFVRFPHVIYNDTNYARFQRCNEAERIIEEYGFDFVNLERDHEGIGLDFAADFYNDDHLNLSGQRKVTEYLSQLLVDSYGITESSLTPKQREQWDAAAQYNQLFYEYCDECMQNEAFGAYYETSELIDILSARK